MVNTSTPRWSRGLIPSSLVLPKHESKFSSSHAWFLVCLCRLSSEDESNKTHKVSGRNYGVFISEIATYARFRPFCSNFPTKSGDKKEIEQIEWLGSKFRQRTQSTHLLHSQTSPVQKIIQRFILPPLVKTSLVLLLCTSFVPILPPTHGPTNKLHKRTSHPTQTNLHGRDVTRGVQKSRHRHAEHNACAFLPLPRAYVQDLPPL